MKTETYSLMVLTALFLSGASSVWARSPNPDPSANVAQPADSQTETHDSQVKHLDPNPLDVEIPVRSEFPYL
jgi:PBP1b-binding outer membrane lipoprotein LpoB